MITQERLKELFRYEDGQLVRRVNTAWCKAGEVAGTVHPKGYRQVQVDGVRYYAHRLIFIYHRGYSPENEIDHIDKNKGNNRIENLREVSRVCNVRNTGNSKNSRTGVKGVTSYLGTGKWIARIFYKGKRRSLGYYDDFVDAVCARFFAEQCIGWGRCNELTPAGKYLKETVV